MLLKDDLERIAGLKRISLANAEKDYLQDLILFSVYSITGKELIFKGGTCLYKVYKLDRFSEDLDFTLIKRLDIRKVSEKVVSDFELLGIKAKIKEMKKYKNGINVRFIINGPLYKGSKETQSFIPLNISLKEKIVLEPIKESIISIYREIPNFEIFVLHEKEILAEKIRAIFTREKARDIYDAWFLLKKRKNQLDLKLINKKLSLYGIEFGLMEFIKRLDGMKGLWETDLKGLLTTSIKDFDIVKSEILSELKNQKYL